MPGWPGISRPPRRHVPPTGRGNRRPRDHPRPTGAPAIGRRAPDSAPETTPARFQGCPVQRAAPQPRRPRADGAHRLRSAPCGCLSPIRPPRTGVRRAAEVGNELGTKQSAEPDYQRGSVHAERLRMCIEPRALRRRHSHQPRMRHSWLSPQPVHSGAQTPDPGPESAVVNGGGPVSPGPTRSTNLDFRHYPLRRRTPPPLALGLQLVTSGRIGVSPAPRARTLPGFQTTVANTRARCRTLVVNELLTAGAPPPNGRATELGSPYIKYKGSLAHFGCISTTQSCSILPIGPTQSVWTWSSIFHGVSPQGRSLPALSTSVGSPLQSGVLRRRRSLR